MGFTPWGCDGEALPAIKFGLKFDSSKKITIFVLL
jgi:hypothetical protein